MRPGQQSGRRRRQQLPPGPPRDRPAAGDRPTDDREDARGNGSATTTPGGVSNDELAELAAPDPALAAHDAERSARNRRKRERAKERKRQADSALVGVMDELRSLGSQVDDLRALGKEVDALRHELRAKEMEPAPQTVEVEVLPPDGPATGNPPAGGSRGAARFASPPPAGNLDDRGSFLGRIAVAAVVVGLALLSGYLILVA